MRAASGATPTLLTRKVLILVALLEKYTQNTIARQRKCDNAVKALDVNFQ